MLKKVVLQIWVIVFIWTDTHSLGVNKTWGWYKTLVQKVEIWPQIHHQDTEYEDFIIDPPPCILAEKSLISHIFVCQELDDEGGGRLYMFRAWASTWMNMVFIITSSVLMVNSAVMLINGIRVYHMMWGHHLTPVKICTCPSPAPHPLMHC